MTYSCFHQDIFEHVANHYMFITCLDFAPNSAAISAFLPAFSGQLKGRRDFGNGHLAMPLPRRVCRLIGRKHHRIVYTSYLPNPLTRARVQVT